jgi:site-specific DNA recombinase
MAAKKRTKCYTYIRVSTEMQVDGYSLDAQKDRLRKFAEYQKMQIVHEYCDAGKSGKSITGRPEFTQMLDDIASQKDDVDYILVFKLSRFGRNAADVLNSLQRIQDFGVNLICVEDGIDSSKESGKLTITVLSAVAEIERENILVQTMEGRKQKAREGKWNGGPAPYGYRLDKENESLVIDPDEAEIVRIVYDKFIHTDMGFDSIADYLNDHGYIKNRSRDFELSHFTHGLVKHILDNPVYLGKIAYGKTVTEKIKGTRDQYHRIGSDDYLLADGRHEAIIDEDTWNAAKAKRQATGVAWKKTYSLEHEHILTGILKCPVCGAGMSGMVHRYHKRSGEYRDIFYYRCKHRRRLEDGTKCDFKPTYREEDLNAEVEKIVLDMIHDENFSAFIANKMEEKVDVSNLDAERENLREQLKQAEGAKKKLSEQLDRLDVNDRHYDRKYQDMQDRMDALYDRISDLEDSINAVTVKINGAAGEQVNVKNLYKILRNFDNLYSKMSDADKKQFYRDFIDTIEVYPDKREDGRIIKHTEFKFPVSYDAESSSKLLPQENGVETVALLIRQN